MNTTADVITEIRACHRRRRYAIKAQQKIDRGLESFIRIQQTNWTPDADEKAREAANRKVKAIIAAARKDEKGPKDIVELVRATDQGRKPFDAMRANAEAEMEKLAKSLPVASWIEAIRGAGLLGLATIVAEAGDLAEYEHPAKLWKRLGFAPYDGCAGSTWKRQTWRPRPLAAEEWIENPFNGERYALIHQIAVWLVNAQWIAAAKTESGEGEPNGAYGEIYARRRAHTAETHPEWTKQHSRMDSLRVTMKAFLLDLWVVWTGKSANRQRTLAARKQRPARRPEAAPVEV
jgi:hypothetical protein